MPVMCYICGREFGTASITIHLPQCEKKWDVEQQKLPKKQRRPPPSKPMEFDRVIKGDLKGSDLQKSLDEYNQQAFDDFNKKALDPCLICGRTFLPRALEIHSRSCKPKNPNAPPPVPKRILSPTKGLAPSRSPAPNSNLVRPGTYKKSNGNASSPTFDPSREDLIAIIEKDVAFSLIENRRKLMDFLKNLT